MHTNDNIFIEQKQFNQITTSMIGKSTDLLTIYGWKLIFLFMN